jgi:malonyl-CoA O-methyltransferase
MDAIALPQTAHPLVVEGAGGLFVPLNDRDFMIDLMAKLPLPILLVARSTLGTINHTLLSLTALRSRGLPVAGVILNGPPNAGNRSAIERFGQVRVLAELPRVDPLDGAAIERLSALIPPLREIAP